MMIIIMMMIQRKKENHAMNVTLPAHTQTLLDSCHLSPWNCRCLCVHWFGVSSPQCGDPQWPGVTPLLLQEADAGTLSTFSPP